MNADLTRDGGASRSALFQRYADDVNAALRVQDMPRAIVIARAADADGFSHPAFTNLLAIDAIQQRDYAQGVALLTTGLVQAPDDPHMLNSLGIVRAQLGEHALAVQAYDALIRVAPRSAAAFYNRGVAHEALGDLPAAHRDFQSAVDIQPVYPEALASLASSEAAHGNNDAARTYAHRALSANPREHSAHLAIASADLAERKFVAAAERLDALVREPSFSPLNRSIAFGLLGDAHHGAGAHALAFEAYRHSKALLQQIYAPNFPAGQALDAVHALIAYFSKVDRWPHNASLPADPGCAQHIFLVGFPRSGTTLLEQALAGHPGVITSEEADLLNPAVRDLAFDATGLDRLSTLQSEDVAQIRAAYWDRARAAGLDARGKLFLDKLPLNTVFLPVIARVFPQAKILFAVRDPRDVVFSCFRRRFAMSPQMFQLVTLAGAAAYYDSVMQAAVLFRDKLPLDVREVRYESIVADAQGELRGLCAFLGLSWDDGILRFAERVRTRAVNTPSSIQIARGLNRDGIDSAVPYRAYMTDVLPVLDRWANHFGYSP